jgi:hypothetical protein
MPLARPSHGFAALRSGAPPPSPRARALPLLQDRRREFERLVLREQELHNEKAEVALRLEATQARVKILETEGRATTTTS